MEGLSTMTEQTDTTTTEKQAMPPRLRLPLATIRDVRRELARIYREGKSGQRDVVDVSRLANVLQILNRCIEGSEFEARLEKLESENNENTNAY
jgi:hypothetical protein